jgi:hypothetical protein
MIASPVFLYNPLGMKIREENKGVLGTFREN